MRGRNHLALHLLTGWTPKAQESRGEVETATASREGELTIP